MKRSIYYGVVAAAMLPVCLNLFLLLPLASAGLAPAPASTPSAAGEQGELQNWSLVSTIVPAPPSTISPPGSFAFAKPRTVAEVQAVVGDTTGKFPSPVLSVGSGHSSGNVVSLVNSSDNAFRGTILQMTQILGMELEEVDPAGGGGGGAGGGGTTAGGRRRSSSLRRRRLEGAAAATAAAGAPAKKYYVRAGGGVILADLHDWLAERQLEISFSPEIGDATLGSSASATMKDSSVRGSGDGEEEQPGATFPPYPPSSVYKGMGYGHLAPLVRGLRYVNASGALVDLDARRSPLEASAVRALGGSFGLMGPVVSVLLETRPLALVETRLKVVPQEAQESDEAFTEKLLALRNECDNMLALISLGGVASSGSTVEIDPTFKRPWAYVELRTRRRGADAQKLPLYNKLSIDWWWPELIRQVKYNAFFQGSVPQYLLYLSSLPVTGSALLGGKIAAIRDRRFFVNRYGPAKAGKPRLSFSYYELDVSKLPQALPAMLAHAADFRRRTGWAPGALAIYFVKRDGIRGESNYAGPPGVSCTMDPVTGAPDDPRFRQFLAESDALLQSFGAMLSPSQSLPTAIGPGQATNFGALDQSLIAEQRFATPYLKQAWAADALWHANNAGK